MPFSDTPKNDTKKQRLLLLNLRFPCFFQPFGCGLHDNKLPVSYTHLRELEKQKQEEENSQIVQAVRSMKLTPAGLLAFLSNPMDTPAASGQSGPKSADIKEKEDEAYEEA